MYRSSLQKARHVSDVHIKSIKLDYAILFHSYFIYLHRENKTAMTKDLIRRYIWLVDTINQAGNEGITYAAISEKWEKNTLLSQGEKYAWRTFMNHKDDILELFGINIA